MALRLLIGDDNIARPGFMLEVRRQTSEFSPTIYYTSTPEDLVHLARRYRSNGNHDAIMVTDLDYHREHDGFWVLEQTSDLDLDRYVWTEAARDPDVRERARSFQVRLLDKNELGLIPRYHEEWIRHHTPK